jgi:hypothetical protein
LHSRLLSSRFHFGVMAALAAACSADPEAGFGVERAAIVNGEPSDETDDQVVDILADSQACSATLVAPDVILTALHCVAHRDNQSGTFGCNPDGSIDPDTPDAGALGLPIDPEEILVFVGANHGTEPAALGRRVFTTGATQICRGDLAAVVLDRPIGTKINSLRFGRSVTDNEELLSVGYGQTEDGFGMGRRRRAVTVFDIGDVGTVPGSGRTPPDTFVVGEGPCHGDSGGPALSVETGALVGVYSLSLPSSACMSATVRNIYTLVPSFEDTIREAFEFAGREPVVEEGSGGTGGTAPTGGTGGNAGEGSGSREDPSCACHAAGGRRPVYGFYALVLAAFAAFRRRGRSRH